MTSHNDADGDDDDDDDDDDERDDDERDDDDDDDRDDDDIDRIPPLDTPLSYPPSYAFSCLPS